MLSNERSRSSGLSRRSDFELVRGDQLVDLALRRLLVDPVEEAGDGGAVAGLRGFLAGDLGGVLERLGKDRRVAQRQDLGAGLVERLEDGGDGPFGIDDYGLALEFGEFALERRTLVEANTVAEVLADVGTDLLARDEQVGGAVGVDDGISQRDRRVGDVCPADVERPGDRIERGQDRRIGVVLDEPVADLRALLGGRLAGIFVGLDDEVRLRGFGTVAPDFVDGVALDRHQLGAAAGERFLRLLHPVARVQPGIVADPSALGRMLLEPLRGARLRHRLVAPFGRADLASDLERVAPVDEDRRLLGKHDGRAGRALEACQPGEALGVASDIFAHMLVGERDDEPVELLGLQLLAKGFQAVGIGGHRLTPLRPS